MDCRAGYLNDVMKLCNGLMQLDAFTPPLG